MRILLYCIIIHENIIIILLFMRIFKFTTSKTTSLITSNKTSITIYYYID